MIKNLVLKGGGVKGIAYVGALRELEKHLILQRIERVAGTSAGSLIAGMLAVGLSSWQIEELMFSLDFKKFESRANPFRILTTYGLYSGGYISDFIRSFLKQSLYQLSPEVTFKEMKDAGCKDLYVFTCNVNSQSIVELSAEATPEVMVVEAIRASMSIPLFFKAFQFSKGMPDDHFYIDGGVVYNYPLSFFDGLKFNKNPDEINKESLGLYLYAKEKKAPKLLKRSMPLFFVKQLFESLMEAQDDMIDEDHYLFERSIRIPDLQISATDFKLSNDDMKNLIASGSQAAADYIAKISRP